MEERKREDGSSSVPEVGTVPHDFILVSPDTGREQHSSDFSVGWVSCGEWVRMFWLEEKLGKVINYLV